MSSRFKLAPLNQSDSKCSIIDTLHLGIINLGGIVITVEAQQNVPEFCRQLIIQLNNKNTFREDWMRVYEKYKHGMEHINDEENES